MKILVVTGGDPKQWPETLTAAYDHYVGVDRGSLYILQKGWPLSMAVGDFDSLTSQEQQQVFREAQDVVKAVPEKDDTDTQLALLNVFQRWPQAEVLLIGATGGRIDHLLANLWLALEERFQPFVSQLQIADKQNHIGYYQPGHYRIKQIADFKYLAYCCLTPVKNLTLVNSKYLLERVTVNVPTSYASNEFLYSYADFSFDEGCIAVVQSKD